MEPTTFWWLAGRSTTKPYPCSHKEPQDCAWGQEHRRNEIREGLAEAEAKSGTESRQTAVGSDTKMEESTEREGGEKAYSD